jgi:alkylated DNA repair dioxygenase AlkB
MTEHQRSLFATGRPEVADRTSTRTRLAHGSWIDVARGWLHGGDDLLDALVASVPWRQGRRRMYDRVLDDPRVSCWYAADAPLPHPVLDEARRALEHRYSVSLATLGLNHYRDGRDSVAFHADRELRHLDDTIVAVLTLGARRPFLVRPKHGGRSVDLAPASGDLLVMGGACQLHYEHAVPKVARAGPRISATWRCVRSRS